MKSYILALANYVFQAQKRAGVKRPCLGNKKMSSSDVIVVTDRFIVVLRKMGSLYLLLLPGM